MRLTHLLRTSDLFERWSSDELDSLARVLQDRAYERGKVLCRQGEVAEEMFIIGDGCVQVAASGSEGAPRSTRALTAGSTIGEVALFSGEAYGATATALTDAHVYVLSKASFETLIADRPKLMRNVLGAVSRRASRANRLLAEEKPATVMASSNGRVYCVFSPRGGSGKSTLAINLAARLSRGAAERVAVFDLNLLFADSAQLLGVEIEHGLAELSAEAVEHLSARGLGAFIHEHVSGLRVLVGAARPEDGERITPAHVQSALAASRRLFQVTVVDCGATFMKPTLAALEAADRVILVCTPELATLRDMRDFKRGFGHVLGNENSRVLYVSNHVQPTQGLARAKFEDALEHEFAVEFPYAAELGEAPLASAHKPFLRALDELVELLEPRAAAARRRTSGSHVDNSAPSGIRRLFGVLRSNGLRLGGAARHGS